MTRGTWVHSNQRRRARSARVSYFAALTASVLAACGGRTPLYEELERSDDSIGQGGNAGKGGRGGTAGKGGSAGREGKGGRGGDGGASAAGGAGASAGLAGMGAAGGSGKGGSGGAAGTSGTAGTGGVACPPGLTSCGGDDDACVDLTSDPANCGDCANVCPTAEECRMGECLPPQCETGFVLGGVPLVSARDARAFAAADVTGDGVVDLAVATGPAGGTTGTLYVLRGVGDGTFVSEADYEIGTDPQSVVITDLGDNGIADVVIAEGPNENLVRVIYGFASEAGSVTLTFSPGEGPVAVVAGDLNHDGLVDLAIANAGSASLTLEYGRSGGSLVPGGETQLSITPNVLISADWNRDSWPDLISASTETSYIGFSSVGEFGIFVTNYWLAYDPTSLASGDFDEDGNIDLVVGNTFDPELSVAYGDGQGQAMGVSNLSLSSRVSGVAVDDFDADGHLDIATAHVDADQLAVTYG
ncbi:MAG TPA: FG-GAP-like repeat-containing protein, partial [Polyangiaceae bacterium]